MITELRLENWKSFGEATLYIDPLSILIGTNASGKSNVLDALQFLQRIVLGIQLSTALQGDATLPPLRGGVEWISRKPHDTFTLSLMVQLDEFSKCRYTIKCSLEGSKCLSVSEKIIHYVNDVFVEEITLEKKHEELSALFTFAMILQPKVLWLVANDLIRYMRSIILFSPNPSLMSDYSTLSDRLSDDAGNIAGVLAALSIERQKEIEDTLTQYASRLPESEIHRVYAEKVGKLGKDAMLYCDEKWGESGEIFTVDARAMSDGTLRFLAILTALLTLPEGSLLAIDEVDNGFHPSRAHLLLEALQTIGKQRNIDVLVTTHNPALLDALGTEFVPFVTVAHRDSITGESKLTLLEDIEQLPKLLAQGTVGKLSTQGLIEKSLESVHG